MAQRLWNRQENDSANEDARPELKMAGRPFTNPLRKNASPEKGRPTEKKSPPVNPVRLWRLWTEVHSHFTVPQARYQHHRSPRLGEGKEWVIS